MDLHFQGKESYEY